MDDGTWGFLTTPERLDAEPRLRQFLLCWECFTKTFPPPLISSLGSEMGPGGLLFEEALLQWGKAWLLFVCHLFDLYAPFLTDAALLPHAETFHLSVKTRHALPPPDPRHADKSNASQGNLIETLCDLWTERIGQEPGSQPTRLLMGS